MVRVGAHEIWLPPKLQGKPCVIGHVGHTPAQPGFPKGKATVLGCNDYVECRDVANASSCRTFDANGNPVLSAVGHSYGAPVEAEEKVAEKEEEVPVKVLPAVPILYAAAETAARVELTVFEWSQSRLGPFPA